MKTILACLVLLVFFISMLPSIVRFWWEIRKEGIEAPHDIDSDE